MLCEVSAVLQPDGKGLALGPSTTVGEAMREVYAQTGIRQIDFSIRLDGTVLNDPNSKWSDIAPGKTSLHVEVCREAGAPGSAGGGAGGGSGLLTAPGSFRELALECIQDGDPALAKRHELVNQVWSKLTSSCPVLLVRAGFGCGKSALAVLLRRRFHSVKVVNLLSWRTGTDLEAEWLRQTGETMEASLRTPSTSSVQQRIYIVDEAQKAYTTAGAQHAAGLDMFWSLTKELSGTTFSDSGVGLILLASYRLQGTVAYFGATPVFLSSSLEARDLAMTDTDAREIIQGYNSAPGYSALPLSANVMTALQLRSGGNIGLFRFLLKAIYERFTRPMAQTGSPSAVSDFVLLDYVASWTAIRDMAQYKAIPLPSNSTEETVLLKELLFFPAGAPSDHFHKESLKTCKKAGYVEEDQSGLVTFTSPVLTYILMERFFGVEGRAAVAIPADLLTLVRDCVASFSARELQQSMSRTSASQRILERQYQMSMYRALLRQLPPDVSVSPDYGSAVPGCKGYLDFFVNNGVQFGIELLRDGDRLQQHLLRFEPGGAYWPITFRESITVDFRHGSEPSSPPNALERVSSSGGGPYCKYVCIVFRDHFKTARIFYTGPSGPQGLDVQLMD